MSNISKSALLLMVNNNIGDIEIDAFDKRLVLQKSIFLLQALGLPLGFNYNWYLRGPYSPELTQAAYGLQDNMGHYKKELEGKVLSTKAVSTIAKFNKIFRSYYDDPKMMELLASLVFLNIRARCEDDKSLKRELFSRKPYLSRCEDKVDVAIKILRESETICNSQIPEH